MPKRSWIVRDNENPHSIEVKWSSWSNAGEIRVDGNVIEAWGLDFNLSQRRFKIREKDAIIRWPGIISSKCELFFDGVLIPE